LVVVGGEVYKRFVGAGVLHTTGSAPSPGAPPPRAGSYPRAPKGPLATRRITASQRIQEVTRWTDLRRRMARRSISRTGAAANRWSSVMDGRSVPTHGKTR